RGPRPRDRGRSYAPRRRGVNLLPQGKTPQPYPDCDTCSRTRVTWPEVPVQGTIAGVAPRLLMRPSASFERPLHRRHDRVTTRERPARAKLPGGKTVACGA